MNNLSTALNGTASFSAMSHTRRNAVLQSRISHVAVMMYAGKDNARIVSFRSALDS